MSQSSSDNPSPSPSPSPSHSAILLGVNVDHIATLRQAREVTYPDPMQAADIARKAGADGITVHLREDRRHIQDYDVFSIKGNVSLPLNLEMAATEEMLKIAQTVRPAECCLVPEKREELTTEGGLDVCASEPMLKEYVQELKNAGIKVSLFIDAETKQIEASKNVAADIIELHTGKYSDASLEQQDMEFKRIEDAAYLAAELGIQVNAGHGLHYQNTQKICTIESLHCLNIGHAIVARAALTGFYEAVFTMKQIMIKARLKSEEEV